MDGRVHSGYPGEGLGRFGKASMAPVRASGSSGPWYRWVVIAYDQLYRLVNGLDRSRALVAPILRLKIRPTRRSVRLADGTEVRRGERIGVIHLNNERVAALRAGHRSPTPTGFEFRRQLITSLHELARLSAAGCPLSAVRAFTATTIFHRGLKRLGFEAAPGGRAGSAIAGGYQRALLASLAPGQARGHGSTRIRAEQLWMSRGRLCSIYSDPATRGPRAGLRSVRNAGRGGPPWRTARSAPDARASEAP